MEADNITVSVIALGTPEDIHAEFLTRTAQQGSGQVYFTTNATELPRLFAMDTVVAARSAFVGTYGTGVVRWAGFSRFFVTATRWLAAQEEPQDWYTSVRREGGEAVVTVEASDAALEVPHQLIAHLKHPDGRDQDVVLARVTETAFEARVPLDLQGVTIGSITMSGEEEDQVLHLPPMALPYSPEFEAVAEGQGDAELRTVARELGCLCGAPVTDLVGQPP